eukprot:TRINITY_DN14853_c0_g1_i2.p1 TRINITY_DN14853_c0_g1~~TRINITY_DN14853_c0_g1_i2.p1  ORF type:complete len:586 (+),score=106.28 TRINITY_DN14853_c0_g1_i2:121-1878(+)
MPCPKARGSPRFLAEKTEESTAPEFGPILYKGCKVVAAKDISANGRVVAFQGCEGEVLRTSALPGDGVYVRFNINRRDAGDGDSRLEVVCQPADLCRVFGTGHRMGQRLRSTRELRAADGSAVAAGTPGIAIGEASGAMGERARLWVRFPVPPNGGSSQDIVCDRLDVLPFEAEYEHRALCGDEACGASFNILGRLPDLFDLNKRLNFVEWLLYPTPKPSYDVHSFPEELIFVPRDDGAMVPCLLEKCKHARFVFLYFHANAEDIGLSRPFCMAIREMFQVHVIAIEYPGYGLCRGKPDEAGIMANASAVMRFVLEELQWPLDGIKLLGRSLGTAPALALAAQYDVAGLILVSPFTSVRELFKHQVGALANWIEDRFNNARLAHKVHCPTLIVHGSKDTIVPSWQGAAIYEAITSRKILVTPEDMTHNSSLLLNVSTFLYPMTHFFSLPDYVFEELEVPAWVFADPEVTFRGSRPATARSDAPLARPTMPDADAQTKPSPTLEFDSTVDAVVETTLMLRGGDDNVLPIEDTAVGRGGEVHAQVTKPSETTKQSSWGSSVRLGVGLLTPRSDAASHSEDWKPQRST